MTTTSPVLGQIYLKIPMAANQPATIQFYRRGANATATVVLPPYSVDRPVPVNIADRIAPGDTIRLGASATTLAVSDV